MRYEVVLDIGETANKCTIAPLRNRSDFRLIHVGEVHAHAVLGSLSAGILLHHEGSCLSEVRRSLRDGPVGLAGIAAIDCVWRRLDGLLNRLEKPLPLLARIPDGFETAYPRRSELDTDPVGGLATIEAIFVAAALLGNWDPSLFSKYYFGRRFIELNRDRFLSLDVAEAADPKCMPERFTKIRDSRQRRADRRQVRV